MRMRTIQNDSKRFVSLVFLVLFLVTCLSWWLAEGYALTRTWPTIIVMTIAAVKLHLVSMHFMELKNAPRVLQIAFHLWIAAVWAVIVGLQVIAV